MPASTAAAAGVDPGGTVDVRVRAIASGGAGVADLPDGRVLFVQRTAPGDLARVQVVREKARWAQGRLVELLEPGEGRRSAPCPYYELCGGCTLEHLRYRDQLFWKARIVGDALERIGGVRLTEPPRVEPSPSEIRYRSRASFHLRRLGGGRIVAGFHELDHPGRIVDMGGSCLLLEESLARVWDRLRFAWGRGAERLPAGEGGLRLTLRSVEGGTVLVVEGGRGRGKPEELIAGTKGLLAIWHRPHRDQPALLLAGERETEETWLGERFRVGASAFMQVNRGAGEQLHQAALAEIGFPRGLSILDAYAGVGALGRRLAEQGARVTAIEHDPEAAAAARRSAHEGFTVLEGRVEARVDEALPVDLALLNPPRGGVEASVLARLSGSGVERIVYVSCDPATLARDVARLRGYQVVRVRCFDLFPQTTHVETLLVLERREGKADRQPVERAAEPSDGRGR
jgi:23S rRNA (uracil1939-C5)-methyltransferase